VGDAHVLVERNRHLDHNACDNVPDHGDASQGTGGVELVAVNDVLVTGHEDTEDPEAEHNRSNQRRPYRDGRACCPAHPEQRDWDRGRPEHGPVETGLRGHTDIRTLGLSARNVALPQVDVHRDQGGTREVPDHDPQEAHAPHPLGQLVDVLVDEGVARQERKEDDVDHGQVQPKEDDDRFLGSHKERTVQRPGETSYQTRLPDLDRATVPRITGQASQLFCLPFQQDRTIGLGLEEEQNS
jgi:hypothetical protein